LKNSLSGSRSGRCLRLARGDSAGGKSVCPSNLGIQLSARCVVARVVLAVPAGVGRPGRSVGVILAIHFISAEPVEAVAKTTMPPSPQEIMVLKEQKQMMAKLIETFDQPAGEPPKPYVPRPKSECRMESVMV